MHKKEKKCMEKDTLADSALSAFFDAIIRICGYFCVADIVCSDSDR